MEGKTVKKLRKLRLMLISSATREPDEKRVTEAAERRAVHECRTGPPGVAVEVAPGEFECRTITSQSGGRFLRPVA
jgi:hypothetical protein